MNGITYEQMSTAVVVILAVIAAIISVDKVIDIIKKWRAPTTDVSVKLANDKQRLDKHDVAIADLQESTGVLCGGIMALLDHELHNGNGEQMQQARDEIMTYLQSKIGH